MNISINQKKSGVIAFCLFKYFPYGGLQRDFMRISRICQEKGFCIRVYTMSWSGSLPKGYDLRIVKVNGFSNHKRAINFSNKIQMLIEKEPVDLVVGFNKMAGLDVYFGADTCLASEHQKRSSFYRATSRAKTFLKLEDAVFNMKSHTFVLFIAKKQIVDFTNHYGLSKNRYELLPSGATEKYFSPIQDHDKIEELRAKYSISKDDFMLLQVGSDYKRKGVDRIIKAIADLPNDKKNKCKYIVVGDDKATMLKILSKKLGVSNNIIFTGPRDDVDQFMKAADLMVHVARTENTGTTIAEALASDLPVMCSGACGYAPLVLDCKAGAVLSEPYSHQEAKSILEKMLDKDKLARFAENAKVLGTKAKLSGLGQRAAEIIIEKANGLY